MIQLLLTLLLIFTLLSINTMLKSPRFMLNIVYIIILLIIGGLIMIQYNLVYIGIIYIILYVAALTMLYIFLLMLVPQYQVTTAVRPTTKNLLEKFKVCPKGPTCWGSLIPILVLLVLIYVITKLFDIDFDPTGYYTAHFNDWSTIYNTLADIHKLPLFFFNNLIYIVTIANLILVSICTLLSHS